MGVIVLILFIILIAGCFSDDEKTRIPTKIIKRVVKSIVAFISLVGNTYCQQVKTQ